MGHLGLNKIIHYCWFGNNSKPSVVKKCIKSWQKYQPGFELKEWNESNFDVTINQYCHEAYKCKKYAFVSDYARFHILAMYGGLYLDTDVEIVKPLDDLLSKEKAFCGFEEYDRVNPGLILWADKNNSIIEEMRDGYKNRIFILNDSTMNLTTVCIYFTDILLKHGLVLNNTFQNIDGFTIYPKEFFCPTEVKNGRTVIGENTYTIHHFAASWNTAQSRRKKRLVKLCIKLLGSKNFTKLIDFKHSIDGLRK